MKLRNLFFGTLAAGSFLGLFCQSPLPAQASLQSCNPTIASISGTSTVNGVTKNMSVPGPGQEVTGGGNVSQPGGGITQAPTPPFSSTETVQGGGLDVTSGMSYRGSGLWQDNLGNRLQLSIQPTRTSNSTGGVSTFPSPCAGSLQGPNGSVIGIPGGFGSSSNQAEIIGTWCIVSSGGCGQAWGLRALVSVNVVNPTSGGGSTGPSNITLNAATCSGTNTFLSWSQPNPPLPTSGVGVVRYTLIIDGNAQNQNGGFVDGVSNTSMQIGPNGSQRSFQVRADVYRNTTDIPSRPAFSAGPSNAISVPANNCAPTGGGGSGTIALVNTTTQCGTNDLTWTTSGSLPSGQVQVWRNGAVWAGVVTNHYNTSAPEGSTFTYEIHIGNVVSNPITITTPTCAPPPSFFQPAPFTVSASAACISGAEVRISLTWDLTASNPYVDGFYVNETIGSGATTTVEQFINSQHIGTHTFSKILPAGSTAAYQVLGFTGIQYRAGGFAPNQPSDGRAGTLALGSGLTSVGSTGGIQLPSCATPVPGPFTGSLAATCEGTTVVATISWTASSGATSYKVFNRDGGDGNPALIASLTSDATSFVVRNPVIFDNGIVHGLYFLINAVNDGGAVAAGAPQDGQPAPVPDCSPQPTITLAAINSVCSAGSPANVLTWTTDSGLTDFTVIKDDAITLTTTTATTYTDTAVTNGSAHVYKVTSGSVDSGNVHVTTQNCPQAPGNFTLTATAGCIGSTAPINHLTWTQSSDAEQYQVERDGQVITTVLSTTTNFDDPAVTGGEAHDYNARAINAVGTKTSNSQHLIAKSDCVPTPSGQPPVANDDTATTEQDTSVIINVLTNDTDPDNNLDPATITVTQNPQHGTVVFDANHIATYTPTIGFSGTDTFIYNVCDTTSLCDTATVTITVTAVNAPPPTPVLPGPLTLTTQTLCTGQTPQNVLSWTASDHATSYVVQKDGTALTTITATNYVDTAVTNDTTYTYSIAAKNTDGTTASNQVTTKTANCAPPAPNNQPPQANDDTSATDQNGFVVIDVLTNDTDPDGQIIPSCTKVVTQPSHGTAVVDTTNGKIAYTPAKDFNGTDTFVYEICDDKGATDTATVTVTVKPPVAQAGPPHANDDAATTPHDKPIDIDILLNDSDPAGQLDPACVKITTQPGHGTVTVNATTGKATYTPAGTFSGTDTFQYTVCNKAGVVSNVATVSIAVGEAPPAVLATTGIPIFGFFVDLWNRFLTFLHLR